MEKTKSAAEFVKEVRKGNISVVEHTHKILDEIKKKNKQYWHFNLIAEEKALEQAREIDKKIKSKKAKGKLLGLPLSVKDCIVVKGIESTAASKILKGYLPLFDATVIERARAEGAIILGKTVQDEFGFGTFSVNVGNGKIPKNPYDAERSCGGSSGGAAGFTALTEFLHVALAESTGGSIACPASFCGVAGLTPTYGRVSRHGLIDYANSLDKIGTIGKSVEDAALLLEVIAGKDENDTTLLPNKVEDYSKSVGKKAKGMKIALVKDFFGKGINEEVSEIVLDAAKKLEKQGAKIREVSLPLNAKYGVACYYLIAVSEASTNLARYCGMRYGLHEPLEGHFDEYFTNVRSKGFGEEAKRRIILGTFARMSGFRDAYYLRAMKARTKLIQEYKKVFTKFDVAMHPTMPFIAPKFSEITRLKPAQQYAADLCTVPANLAGLPHLSVNAGFSEKMPVGIMFTADHLQEKKIITAGSALESAIV